jgi:hypothetical protein
MNPNEALFAEPDPAPAVHLNVVKTLDALREENERFGQLIAAEGVNVDAGPFMLKMRLDALTACLYERDATLEAELDLDYERRLNDFLGDILKQVRSAKLTAGVSEAAAKLTGVG